MLRYVALGVMCLLAGGARAQQATPSPTGTPAAASSAAPANPPKAAIVMEAPLPGDHWTYDIRDEITGKISFTRENVVTEVSPKEISVRVKNVNATNDGLNVYDRSWNLTSAGQWKYAPGDGTGIQTPLAVGKTWTSQSTAINAGEGFGWNRSGKSTVTGKETITTKAGTFETFKIETTYTARNIKDPTRKEEVASQTWYAPAIDHWVKRTFISHVDKHLRVSNTFELIEYGRKE